MQYVTTETLERIYNHLKNEQGYSTLSSISKKTGVHFYATKSAVATLKDFQLVDVTETAGQYTIKFTGNKKGESLNQKRIDTSPI